MQSHTTDFLIVGGGMAADAAIRSLNEQKPSASITLLSADSDLPYDRPPLTKDLITDPDTTLEDVLDDPDIYSEKIETVLGRKAVRLEPDDHVVWDDQGDQYTYGKLLLATGGRPKRLPGENPQVLYYRNLNDFKRLQEDMALGRRIAVIGDGFIGCEIAASLSETSCEPFMIFPHHHLGSDRFPLSLSKHLDDLYQSHGIDLLPDQRVTDVSSVGDSIIVTTDGGGKYAADHAVAGLGILPNIQLAEEAGLIVDDGIRVNERLQTSHPDVFAAGDNASAYRESLGAYKRVEHEMNALEMGKAAGRAMTDDQDVSFKYLPLFYSDFFDTGFEAVGELSADLDMVEDWQDGFEKGVVYYLKEDRIRGVLLWKLFGQTDQALTMMREERVTQGETLKGRITD